MSYDYDTYIKVLTFEAMYYNLEKTVYIFLSKVQYTFVHDGLTGFSAYNSQNNGQCCESSQERKKHDQN